MLSISDGNNLRVRDGGRTQTVSLACIDTPEISIAPKAAAPANNYRSWHRWTPSLRWITATDRCGQSVLELSRDARNFNQALVTSATSFVYWQYIIGCDHQTYSRLERDARLKGLGVWDLTGGITRLLDYRSAQRRSGSAAPSGRRHHSWRVQRAPLTHGTAHQWS